MPMRELIPWRKKEYAEGASPITRLQREMNKLFDEVFEGWGLPAFATRQMTFAPRVDLSESDKEVRVTAELPGIDEKNVEVSITADALTISGEKKEEHEQKEGAYHMVERSYGSFSRTIALPREVDADKAKASYKNGVLEIVLPKTEASTRKKIEIKSL